MNFEDWLLTPDGQTCNTFWTLNGQPYLRNRLWWAFNAGEKNNSDRVQWEQVMMRMDKENRDLKMENNKLKNQLKKLKPFTYTVANYDGSKEGNPVVDVYVDDKPPKDFIVDAGDNGVRFKSPDLNN